MDMTPDEQSKFIKQLAAALATAPHDDLTDDERRWVRMAILRDAQSYEFRRAIIEKTLAGLAWAAILWIGVALLDHAKTIFRG